MRRFLGRWIIQRTINDVSGTLSGRLEGEAAFSLKPRDETMMEYQESGLLTIATAPPIRAERTYLWRDQGHGSVDVLFADGRPFHRVNLNQQMPFDTHFCSPDIYGVNYDFREWPRWTTLWKVRGPRKAYQMETRYRRISDGSPLHHNDH